MNYFKKLILRLFICCCFITGCSVSKNNSLLTMFLYAIGYGCLVYISEYQKDNHYD